MLASLSEGLYLVFPNLPKHLYKTNFVLGWWGINLDFWPFSYFQRKSEERRNKLKEEILTELSAKAKPFLEEQGKSVKKDGERLVKDFSKEVKDARTGLETQVKDLMDAFQSIKSQSEKVSGESSVVKKDSERIKVCAEEAKKEADGAVNKVQTIEAVAKRANELCDTIDAKLKEYTGNAVSAAVEKCTAAVTSEMDAAVKAAREEYKMNLDDSVGLLEEKNMRRMNELSAKLNEAAKSGIDAFQKECRAAIDAFKKEYAAVQADYQKILPRLDAAAQKFKKIEAQINSLEAAMHGRPQYLVTATLLSSMQRQQLRELYSSQYKGDALRYKKYLESWKESQLKGKRNGLTPAELEIDFVPQAFDNMLNILRQYRREEMPDLLDAANLVDGIKNSAQANNMKPGSGRQNKH